MLDSKGFQNKRGVTRVRSPWIFKRYLWRIPLPFLPQTSVLTGCPFEIWPVSIPCVPEQASASAFSHLGNSTLTYSESEIYWLNTPIYLNQIVITFSHSTKDRLFPNCVLPSNPSYHLEYKWWRWQIEERKFFLYRNWYVMKQRQSTVQSLNQVYASIRVSKRRRLNLSACSCTTGQEFMTMGNAEGGIGGHHISWLLVRQWGPGHPLCARVPAQGFHWSMH